MRQSQPFTTLTLIIRDYLENRAIIIVSFGLKLSYDLPQTRENALDEWKKILSY